VPISRQSLEPILTDLAAKQFSEPMRPSLIQLWMLDDRLFALRMNRVMPDGRFKFDSISVLQLNLVGDVAKVERHWNIENMFQLGEQDQVSGLRADQEHRLEFSVEDNDGWHKCTFIAADETNAECDVLGSSQPTGKYKLIAGRLGKEQWDLPVLTVSPSGKWTAWAEWNSGDGWDDGGRVRLYLATTADLLP
jgi:hypothetical protein